MNAKPLQPPVLSLLEGALNSYETWVAFAERAAELTRDEVRRRLRIAATREEANDGSA